MKPPDIALGTVTRHPDGFGFLRVEGPERCDDVFLPPPQMDGLLGGDRVRVKVRPKGQRFVGEVIERVERRQRQLIGTLSRRRGAWWIEPLDARFGGPLLLRGATLGVESGAVAKAEILEGPRQGSPALGQLIEVLGPAGHPAYEILAVAYAQGFDEGFPAEVAEAAEATPEVVRPQDREGRRDLRTLPLVTIDGADARDFDDAVFVERVPGEGFRLVVAIADVAHYVRDGEPLDTEAQARSTSVYFPGKVIPMLPEALSNGICSLNPEVERLCMVADLTLDSHGRTVNTEVYEAVMRSHARLTYEQVAAMMGELELPVEPEHRAWADRHLPPAVELSRALNRRRVRRGSVEMDIPERKPVLGEDGRPERIERRTRLWAHRMIEEFMLAANEAVAWFFDARGLPTIYRVHDEPDEEKLETFAALARAHGFAPRLGEEVSPQAINRFLSELDGRPEQRALNTLLLRSMQQAIYSAENIGHYGLAASHYLHFTSPIRRYPDLIVHRLLKAHLARAGRVPTEGERAQIEDSLDEVSTHCSQQERAAMKAEREIDDFFAALYMEPRVGEQFSATVASVTDFGLFVELDDHNVEGLLRAEHLGSRWEFDAATLSLIFSGSGARYRVGDRVEVLCASVNVSSRRIDLEPVDGGERGAADPGRGGKKPTKRRKILRADGSEASGPTRRGRRAETDAEPREGEGGAPRRGPEGGAKAGGPRQGGRPGKGAPAKKGPGKKGPGKSGRGPRGGSGGR